MTIQEYVKLTLANKGVVASNGDFKFDVYDFTQKGDFDKAYVYFLTGYFPDGIYKKIGFSKNPVTRVYPVGEFDTQAITFSCPFPVFINWACLTSLPRELERFLHEKYERKRRYNRNVNSGHSEWFIDIDKDEVLNEVFAHVKKNKLYKIKTPAKLIEEYEWAFVMDIESFIDWLFSESQMSTEFRSQKRRAAVDAIRANSLNQKIV